MISSGSVFFWFIIILLVCLVIFFPQEAGSMFDKIVGKDVPQQAQQAIDVVPEVINNFTEIINDSSSEPVVDSSFDSLTIANWNLQIFGVSKASNEDLMFDYVDVIEDYDIVFVQEIRDSSGSAFKKLCDLTYGYNCAISSRAGRSSSKEQYGVIYKEGITLDELADYNPDSSDRWERPPVRADFSVDNYSFSVYNLHTKPSDVQMELRALQDVVGVNNNEIVMGDLNADCDYYNAYYGTEFDNWNWVISDYDDTTVGSTNCAYDRIIFNDDSYKEYLGAGVRTKDITPSMSDHYLVWANISLGEN